MSSSSAVLSLSHPSSSGMLRVPQSCLLDPFTTRRQRSSSSFSSLTLLHAKKKKKSKKFDKDDDDDNEPALGMDAAFEKLDSLSSLDDAPSRKPPKTDTPLSTSTSSSLPLEKEIEVYKNLMGESESKQDVYSNVLADMVTTDKDDAAGDNPNEGTTPSSSSSVLDDPAMQQALADAMQQVSSKNPQASSAALNDEEIMKEIKAIMERGNAKLLASLEEIRQEQVRACMHACVRSYVRSFVL